MSLIGDLVFSRSDWPLLADLVVKTWGGLLLLLDCTGLASVYVFCFFYYDLLTFDEESFFASEFNCLASESSKSGLSFVSSFDLSSF
jgi:hypothetical protein